MRNLFIIALIFLILTTLKKKVMDTITLKQILIRAGFPADRINYFVAQALFESPNLNSNVAQVNNNLTGITFINKPYQRATKGSKMPSADGNGYYAKFKNLDDWASDYKRILSLNTGKQGRPIDAQSIPDFVRRLKANGYFGGNEKNYLAGVEKKLTALA